jgi:Protein of unknown function (DUF4236)
VSVQFRRRRSFGPIRLSVSQRGLSTSIGGGPFRLSLGADGKVRRTVRVPGAGIWDTKVVGDFVPAPHAGRAGLLTSLVELAVYVALLAFLIAVLVTG